MSDIARELTDTVTKLRRALRRSVRDDERWRARPVAQIEILQSIADASPSTVSDLAVRLRLAQSAVSGLIARLVADGLIERTADPRDGRAMQLALSAAGRAELTGWEQANQARLGAALATLDAADLAAVRSAIPALRGLATALNESPPAASDRPRLQE